MKRLILENSMLVKSYTEYRTIIPYIVWSIIGSKRFTNSHTSWDRLFSTEQYLY